MSPQALLEHLQQPYEVLLEVLRSTTLDPALRERLEAELKSRDRAAHNLAVAINGGELK